MLILGQLLQYHLKPNVKRAKFAVIEYIYCQTCPAHLGPWLDPLTHYRLEFKKHRHLASNEQENKISK
jgi:hypothetical protein